MDGLVILPQTNDNIHTEYDRCLSRESKSTHWGSLQSHFHKLNLISGWVSHPPSEQDETSQFINDEEEKRLVASKLI